MNPFEQLLTTQELDTRLDQLAHRRGSLPEIQVLDEAGRALMTSQTQIDAADEDLAALRRAQRHVEDTLATVETRAADLEKTLYDGSVTGARDLQDHQTELENVKRRASDLEDDVLAGLERIEAATARLEVLRRQHQAVIDVRDDAQVRLTAAAADIDAEIAEVTASRAGSVTDIPPVLLEEYDRLRAASGGVAVARLERNRCGGCHLTLASAEVDRIRHLEPDVTPYCEECGRILVR